MSTVGEVVAIFTANTVDFDRGVASVQAKTAELGASTSNMAKVGAVAWAALGVAAVAGAAVSVEAATKFETAHARLATTLKNTGTSMSAQADAIETLDGKMRALGFTDTQTEDGMARLQAATKNVGQSTKDMALAADIARGRHMDLASATQLLVKVETGHVALLGRIGINVKDANGAIISQKEAIQRLTDLYGGQASAYTETFAGRIEVLKATFDRLAVQVGEVLIPVIESLATGLSDTIDFFEQNKAAAIALATVVGGPLVYAMGAFVAVKIGAAIDAMVTSFVTLRAAIGATLESMGLLGEGAGAAALGLGILAAGLTVALLAGYALHKLLDVDLESGFKKGAAQAKNFASSLNDTVSKIGDFHQSIGFLKGKLKELEDGQNNIVTSTQAEGGGFLDASQKAVFYKNAIDSTKKKIAELKQEQIDGVEAAHTAADAYGVTIPAGYSKSEQALKSFGDTIGTATALFGPMGAQAMLNVGMTVSAMQSLNKATEQFAADFEAGIQKASDPWAHFQNETAVTEQQMEAFFTQSNADAIAWSQDLGSAFTAMHSQLSGSAAQAVEAYVANIAKLGPSAKPALDAFVDMANEHGWQWVADNLQAVTQAEGDTEAAYQGMAAAAAVSAAEQAAVQMAAQDLIKGHGTSAFHELLNSADENLRGIATAALEHLGYTQAQIDQLHGKNVDIYVTSNVDEVVAHVQAVLAQNSTVPGAGILGASLSYTQAVGDFFGGPHSAHGMVAFARGGFVTGGPQMALIGEDGPEAVIPFTKYDDMVQTIANTGQAPKIAKAAAQAIGLASNNGTNGLTGFANPSAGGAPFQELKDDIARVGDQMKAALDAFWDANASDDQRNAAAAQYSHLAKLQAGMKEGLPASANLPGDNYVGDAAAKLAVDQIKQLNDQLEYATNLALQNFWQAQTDQARATDSAMYTALQTFHTNADYSANAIRDLMAKVLDDFWHTTDAAQQASDAALYKTLSDKLNSIGAASAPGTAGDITGTGTVSNGSVSGTVKLDSSDLKEIIAQLITVLGQVVTSEDDLSKSEGNLSTMIGALNSTLGIGYSPSGGFLTVRG